MRKVSVVAIMGLCFVAGIAFVYSCGGGSSSSAGTIGELEDRVLALENKLTPAYDSGWLVMDKGDMLLYHNVGGDLDDYLIDVTQRTTSGVPGYVHKWYPGDLMNGLAWKIVAPESGGGLHNTAISVMRGINNNYGEKIRVRIWDFGY